MLAIQVPLITTLLPALEKNKISPPLASEIHQIFSSDTPIATFGYAEPSFNFYMGRRLEHLGKEEELLNWVNQAHPGVLIAADALLQKIEEKQGPLGLKKITSRQGLNIAKGPSVIEVSAFGRGL